MAWSKLSRQARGYGAAWDRKRLVIIARDMGLCQPCARAGRVTKCKAVDHIVSKAKAKRLGWSQERIDGDDNLECVCKPCHDRKSVEEVGATYHAPVVYGDDGWPIE